MRALRAVGALGALAALGGGCDVKSKLYCGMHPDDTRCATADAAPPDSSSCTSNASCTSAAAPACDTTTGACVACVDDSTCANPTPTCGSDQACHGCAVHADCPLSNTCLDTGACADPADVAYVQSTGSGSACSFDAPCVSASLGLLTGRPYVRILGASSTIELSIARDVTFLGDPGSSQLTGTAPITFEPVSHTLTIEGLTLTSTSTMGIAVDVDGTQTAPTIVIDRCEITGNDGGGVLAPTGAVTITRSNIHDNAGGGITLGTSNADSTFTVINNFITRNGVVTKSGTAGAMLYAAAGSKFEFNTVVDNAEKNAPSFGGGVYCVGSIAATNNIIARNDAGGVTTGSANLVGTCTAGTSNLDADVTSLDFVQPQLSEPGDYHIMAGSVAIGAGSADPAVTVDYDGNPRPTTGSADLGADQLAP